MSAVSDPCKCALATDCISMELFSYFEYFWVCWTRLTIVFSIFRSSRSFPLISFLYFKMMVHPTTSLPLKRKDCQPVLDEVLQQKKLKLAPPQQPSIANLWVQRTFIIGNPTPQTQENPNVNGLWVRKSFQIAI